MSYVSELESSEKKGEFMPRKRVTISDIAKELGLSKRAVSQALRDRPGSVRVSAATKARVLLLAEQMNYRENLAARALFTGRSGIYGVLGFHSHMHGAHLRVTTAITEFEKYGQIPMVVHAWAGDGDPELRNAHLLIDARVNAVLVIGSDLIALRYAREIQAYGIPVVAIASHEMPGVVTFGARRRDGFRQLTGHLIESGHRRLAVMLRRRKDDGEFSAAQQALEGIRDALDASQSADISRDFRIIDTAEIVENEKDLDFFPDVHGLHADGYLAMWHLIESGEPLPDAILCIVDGYAMGALRACAEAGVRVPEDLALTGYGNDPAASASTIPITTVAEPDSQLCELAVRHLIAAVDDLPTPPASDTILSGWLIVRRSSSTDSGLLPKDLFKLTQRPPL